jgi:hypothetical protein
MRRQMFRFRLINEEDSADLGPFATNERDWMPGERIERWAGENLEVVRMVEAEDGDDVDAYLVVAAVMKM